VALIFGGFHCSNVVVSCVVSLKVSIVDPTDHLGVIEGFGHPIRLAWFTPKTFVNFSLLSRSSFSMLWGFFFELSTSIGP